MVTSHALLHLRITLNKFSWNLGLLSRQLLQSEVESRTQGSRPRPRTQKKSEAKDSLSEDRHSRGQGQESLRPRQRTKDTSASALQKKKKKVFTKIFQAISTKTRFPKNFSSTPQNFNNSKNTAVLEPRTGQFSRTWGLEAKDLTFEAKAKDFKMCPRGQGRPRGLHLWLQFQMWFLIALLFDLQSLISLACSFTFVIKCRAESNYQQTNVCKWASFFLGVY